MFNSSCDVPLLGWKPADTLIYDFAVTEQATIKNPISLGRPYQLLIGIRHASNYPLTTVPINLQLQLTDTTGGRPHAIRNLMRQQLSPAVRDSTGFPLGDTWGSFIELEQGTDLTIRFDTAGTYRFLVTPELGGLRSIPGLSAIGLRIRE